MTTTRENHKMRTIIIRLPEVERRTGRSRSAIYTMMKQGLFPQAVRIGRRAVGWDEDEIEAYNNTKVTAHRRG
jgi:prophage regulatory protein